MTGWDDLRALIGDAEALLDEIEPLAREGSIRAWQVQTHLKQMAGRLEDAAKHLRQAGASGYQIVRDETGQVVRLEWRAR